MNYSSECIRQTYLYAEQLLNQNLDADSKTACILANTLQNAHKFIFPDPSKMNINANAESLCLMKLPYPVCAFEYFVPENEKEPVTEVDDDNYTSSKRIALAFDCSKDIWPISDFKKTGFLSKNSKGILVISFFNHDQSKIWSPHPIAGYIDQDIAESIDNFHIKEQKGNITYNPIPLLNGVLNTTLKNFKMTELMDGISSEIAMTICATLMLNTKNLKIIQAVQAPEKLNKKRIKNNKIPFFDYYTLDLFFSNSGNLVDRKKINYTQIQQQINNSILMKRWGTVRGHFKVRSTGVFWWSDHARGNKFKGIIKKDYELKPEKKFKP